MTSTIVLPKFGKKLPLQVREINPNKTLKDRERYEHWTKCLPYLLNTRGRLIHRPRSIERYIYGWHGEVERSHLILKYWCGGGSTDSFPATKIQFHEMPPENWVVCERCEFFAVKNGLPASDTWAGRHVCLGGIEVKRTCGCPKRKEDASNHLDV